MGKINLKRKALKTGPPQILDSASIKLYAKVLVKPSY